MRYRFVALIATVAAAVALQAQAPAVGGARLIGQVGRVGQVGRSGSDPAKAVGTSSGTLDSQRDLSGIWTNATMTPLERPGDLAGKEFFTEAEAAAYEKQARQRNDADRRDSNAEADLAVGYNAAWWDRGTSIVSTRRTSLIVDPPDGRVPPLTSDAQQKAAARAEVRRLHPADGPENLSLADRCVVRGTAVPPCFRPATTTTIRFFKRGSRRHSGRDDSRRSHHLDARPHLEKSDNGWETRAAGGKGARWSSRRRISPTRPTGRIRRGCVSSNASRADDSRSLPVHGRRSQSFTRPWSEKSR